MLKVTFYYIFKYKNVLLNCNNIETSFKNLKKKLTNPKLNGGVADAQK